MVLRQYYLVNLFRKNSGVSVTGQMLDSVGIGLTQENLFFLAFFSDSYQDEIFLSSPEYKQIRHIVSTHLSDRGFKNICFINSDGGVICLLNIIFDGLKSPTEQLYFLAKTTINQIREQTGFSVSCAVEGPTNHFEDLRNLYSHVNTLLEQRFYSAGGSVCMGISGRNDLNGATPEQYRDTLQKIHSEINRFEYYKAKQDLEVLFQLLSSNKNMPPCRVRNLCLGILDLLYGTLSLPEHMETASEHRGIYEHVMSTPLFSELSQFVMQEIEKSISRRYQETDLADAVQQAIQYISRNYGENISLSSLCSIVHMSESYFSKLFKDKTGENFNSYLSQVRINNAKQLLKNSNLKIGVVAAQVGYPNVSYFTQVFKKLTGLSPEQYRLYHYAGDFESPPNRI